MNALAELRERGREIAGLAHQIRELCGDDDIAFIDTLDGETDAVRAASAVVRMIGAQEAMETAARTLANRYAARASDFSSRAERARMALLGFMQEIGERSLVLPEGTITAKASGSRKLLGDCPADELPERFVKVKREPDRATIKAALEAGEVVDGFSLSNAQPSLQIRK
jgi:hypothetical protein